VRLVAANLTSGSNQAWDNGEGIRILQGVHGDIVMLQEFNYQSNLTANFQTFANMVCGVGCVVTRGPDAANGIPNGIVSRYPFVTTGSWTDALVTNRNFVWAQIDVPGPTDLWAISVHLLTSSSTDRANEAAELMNLIQTNVPAGAFVVIGGDFNTGSRTEAALTNFDPIFQVLGPYAADQLGNDKTSTTRTKPYDWVLANDALDVLKVPLKLGANVFAAGLVADTRVYNPIADLAPALTGDSGATNMQHMGVVRDFLLPSP
jgi:hypothetical protein